MNTPHERPAHRPQKVLVTGGGGFLGRAIVERLVARGDEVRSFSRGDYPELRKLGVDQRQGDLADADAVRAACADRDVVMHVAGKPGVWGSIESFYQPNVRGTDHVLAACKDRGVGRLVYTSSPSVVFDGRDVEGGDESLPYPRRHKSHYGATKALAEKHVLAANSEGLRTVALRPHLVWGPRDNHLVPRLVALAKAGRLRRIGAGRNRVDSTYIDNAADAHVLAADALETNPAAAGRAYFVSNGEPIPVWELIDRILAAAGLEPVRRSISPTAARAIGGMLEFTHWLFRIQREPRMTRFVAGELSTSHWFNIAAARRELGYEPRVSIDEGLRRLGEWLKPPRPAAKPPQLEPVQQSE